MKKNVIAVLLCCALAFSGCSANQAEETSAQAAQDETEEQKIDSAEETDATSEETNEETKSYQAKLDVIEPSAYNNADGLSLEKGAYISVIGKAADGAFWTEVQKGVLQAAEDINKKLGYTGKDKVKVTYNGPAKSDDVDEQVNILDEELDRYPVAVAISIADAQACEVQFDIATENGIPVVAFDSGSDYKGLMAMVSTDNKEAAVEAADKMAELVGEGEVIVIAHDSKSETASVREKRFIKRMKKKHSGITIAGDYRLDEMAEMISAEVNEGTYSLDGEEATGRPLAEEEKITAGDVTDENIMDYILKKHPNVKGIYATNGESVTGVVEGLDRAGMTGVNVVGYDADEAEIQAVKDGKIQGLIVQNPFGMGYASVIAAARASLSLGNEAYVDTGYIWVTQENVESEEVQEMLY